MKKNHFTFRVLIVFVSAVFMLGLISGIQLRYAFKKDHRYRYLTNMKFFEEGAKHGTSSGESPVADISVGFSLSVSKVSSSGDLSCTFTADTMGVQMSDPSGPNRVLTFEKLKGKTMHALLDPRGVLKSIQPDDPSSLNQTRELGIEFFSRDLLNFTYMFVEFPAGGVELNRSWEYARTDTISRGIQKFISTRTTHCTLTGTAMVGNRRCYQIAYAVVTRIRSLNSESSGAPGMKGENAANGVISFSEDGIPLKSEATIRSSFTAGPSETVQRRTLKTVLE